MKDIYYLYGNKMMISEFAEHNKDKYNIGGVIIGDYRNEKHSNFYLQFTEEEKNASSILEAYEILDLSRNIEIIKKGRIVICQMGIYANGIEDYLDFFGFVYGEDYEYSAILETENSDRKTVILHGYYCFVRDLYIVLNSIESFRGEYNLIPALYEKYPVYPYRRIMNQIISKAYIYIYNQESKPYYYFKSELPQNCKVISIPCINFGGFHPQILRKGAEYFNPLYIEPKGPTRIYLFGDKYVNEMILKGMSSESIFKVVSDENFIERHVSEQSMQRELRIMEVLERQCDVKIAEFVKERYKTTRLFPICDHWTLGIAKEFARQILDLLDIQGIMNIRTPPKRYNEVPIYPCVAKALGIEWVNEETEYYMQIGKEHKYLTFEEYIYSYSNVMRAMYSIKKIW